jgi:DNA polymerase III epsilon subunit-like protein
MRFVCLDFETNGFYDEKVYVLPWTSYPIQVSLTAVDDGVVTHLYDSLIRGAKSFATWVDDNVPIKVSDLDGAPTLRTVISQIASKMKPDDFIVAHNARFDMEQCLRRTAHLEGIKGPELDSIMDRPRFCTQNCEYVKSALRKGERRLEHLCKQFGVDFQTCSAHDATYDTLKLAECVAEALYRGVMLPIEKHKAEGPPTEQRLKSPF